MKLLVNSTPVALWHDVVHEAENACDVTLNAELEAYLVFLLDRYTNKPELFKQIIATQFLQGIDFNHQKKDQTLQEVGDKCLLFSGLFPKIAVKRLVKIGYFVSIGQMAYESISKNKNDVYDSLAKQFVLLMDILQSIRCYSEDYPDLLPFEAYDLWDETGSKRALSVLKQYTNAIPQRIHK